MPLFKSLNERELLRIAANLKQVEFHDGDHVITENAEDDGAGMYIVETGTAVVQTLDAGVICELVRGDFFGAQTLVISATQA
eukprot:SAG11_NODE_4707_length_1797_cov_1.153121_1_plen_82_part_00